MNYRKVAEAVSSWIAQKTREAGAGGVVVGISGGVDSAVVLALGRRAVGDNVLGLIMPCESSRQDTDDAQAVAELLGARTTTVVLEGPYRQLLERLPEGSQMARANLKPRLRMATLYYFANTMNYLVAGTGNRSELAVGYFTKHGDGAADILPIGGLVKSQVRKLAHELNIPRHIIEKVPSAGLWPGQTDEGEIGMSYETLDEIIEALGEGCKPKAPAAAVARVESLMGASAHKRSLPPICETWKA